MASFNLTVEDSSPLISYSPAGAWVDTPFTNDVIDTYSGRSFHMTTTPGSSATFQFNGTGMSVFGGARSTYGTYTLAVDGQTVMTGSAQSTQDESRKVLASVSGLPNGAHTAILTSTGTAMDIDFIQLTTQMDAAGSSFITSTMDDGNPLINYSPPTSWQVNKNTEFLGGTLHFTQDPDASATVTFSGDAVAIYGTTAPDHADCVIELDGQSSVVAGGSGGKAAGLHTAVLMFFQNGLGSGSHTLKLSARSPSASAPFFDLDSISVFAAQENAVVGSSPSSSSLPTSSSGPTSSKAQDRIVTLTPASMVGFILAGIVALFAIAGFIFFLIMRRRRRRAKLPPSRQFGPGPASPGGLPMQYPRAMESVVWGPTREMSFDVAVAVPPPVVPDAKTRHQSIAPSLYSQPSPALPVPPLPAFQHSRSGSKSSIASSQATLLNAGSNTRGGRVSPFISGSSPQWPGKDISQRSEIKPPVRPKVRPPTLDLSIVGAVAM